MGIVDALKKVVDIRNNGEDCQFNGYLEDYVNSGECRSDVKQFVYTKVLDVFPNCHICVGLKSGVDVTIIPNQIIRYKDVGKLGPKSYTCPDILYLSGGENMEKALIYSTSTKGSYLKTKGCYLILTEPGALLEQYRNDIVALSSDDGNQVVNTLKDLFVRSAGSVQRYIERKIYPTYDALFKDALSLSEATTRRAYDVLPTLSDRTSEITDLVYTWFLLKKICYVSYMLDKSALNTVHEGNTKAQRSQAKLNADAIKFIPYSELWRIEAGQENSIKTSDDLD